jgi:hypothetical protein
MNLARLFPISALLSASLAANPAAAQATAPTTPVGTTSAVQAATLTLSADATIGSINVLTQGVTNQDFQSSSGGTCTVGQAYTAGQSCTVKYVFKPTHPGSRYGAVVLHDNATPANAIATTYLYGTGNGPQVIFSPPKQSALPTSLTSACELTSGCGMAVDAKGNLFVASYRAVYEVLVAGGYSKTVELASGFSNSAGVAVDGAGNVFVADTGNNAVKEIVAASGYSTILTLGHGFLKPSGVAVDRSGNVFVADTGNYAVREIVAEGSYSTIKTPFTGANGDAPPYSVAIDGSDNLFIALSSYDHPGSVFELFAASGYTTKLTFGPRVSATPFGLAVDGVGNVFVSVEGNRSVKEILAKGGYTTIVTWASVRWPRGVAVGARGNVFFTNILSRDSGNVEIQELDFSDPSALTFADTTVGSTNSPKAITVTNDGNQALQFSDLSYPADFPEHSGVATDCTSSTSLAGGDSCTLSVDFSPLRSSATGPTTPLSETVSLTDNNLNVSDTARQITTTGNAIFVPPALTSPVNAINGSSATFTWTPGSATTFKLRLGTTPGSNNIYGSGPTNATSVTVSGIPSQTIYAQLYYMLNSAWYSVDYTFIAAPQLTSPAPGSTLSGPNITFSWTPGSSTNFQFRLGTTVGGNEQYDSGVTSSTSETVYALPTNGKALYARLYYQVNSIWQYNDYTYTASPAPSLTSPTPGSTLSGSTVTFTWNPGGSTTFQFRLGTTLGSNNIYGSGQTTKTSETVSNLPTNSETIHAVLYYMVNGAWQNVAYTYTAQ